MSKDYYIIPIFVPHLGCPHNCVFCNQRRITGKTDEMDENKAQHIIEEHLSTIPSRRKDVEIAFYGGSFTGIDLNLQERLLNVAFKYKKEGAVDRIRLSTRPDYIDKLRLDILKKYHVDIIELGVQSLDDEVLILSGRGHNKEDVYRASDLIKSYGFKLGLQMMIGLPGDNMEKSLLTGREIIKMNPFCVRIYPTLVIKDTYLKDLYEKGEYIPLSLEEAIDISSKLLVLFERNNIDVIRIGLQPTDNMTTGKDVVAGPFHPAFRQLVESRLYRDFLEEYFKNFQKEDIKNKIITIETKERNISPMAGQKSSNIKYLKELYDFSDIKIYKKDMDSQTIIVHIEDHYDIIDKKDILKNYFRDIV